MAGSQMSEMITHPAFRGLWRSRQMNDDGSIQDGWSVTFVFGGDYCEVPYQIGPDEACAKALALLADLKA